MAKKLSQTKKFSNFTSLREAAAQPSVSDGNGGRVYKGATIIRAGLGNRRDKNYYPVTTLESAAERGMFEGLRAYADHQNSVDEEIQPERSIRDIVGIYTNTKFVREGNGGRVVGDLRVLKAHKWLSDMVDELIEVGHADKVGISINGRGQTMPGRVTLEESGEEIEVNELKQFIDLRSADVVTEAGAGGGFQQILESARGAAKGKGAMDKKQILEALAAATEAGDVAKVEELTAKLREACGCTKAAEKGGEKVEEDGADASAAEGEEVTEEASDDAAEGDEVAESEDGEDAEGEEADADESDDAEEGDALDAAVEEAVAGTDIADETDCEEAADCDDEDKDEEVTESEDMSAQKVKSAVEKLKAHADKDGAAKEAGKKLTKSDPSTGKGKGTALINGKKKTHKGRPLPLNESEKDREISRLQNKVAKLTTRNERLAEALRIRTSADRARKLLKESGIPEKLQPELLHRLVGKSEDEMKKEIRFHQRLVESVVGTVRESKTLDDFEDGDERFEKVEGAGSRVRESYGGDEGDDIVSMVTGSGLPIKK